jgi:hypothetical protein
MEIIGEGATRPAKAVDFLEKAVPVVFRFSPAAKVGGPGGA